jgi:hypothetical protein
MSDTNEHALKQVNRSGFPFQLKVERDVEAAHQVGMHKWSVASREHAWADAEGNTGYIDIVLKHQEFSTFRLVLECKRVKSDDARQLQWLFLVEEAKADFADRASCFEVEADLGAKVWDDVRVSPFSLESQFCVLQGDDGSRKGTLLEKLAQELLRATEGLAEEEIKVEESIRKSEARERGLHVRLFLFPMIVTNAKIAVCRFAPERVDLTQGVLHEADIFEVPMIRFRKSLVTDFPEGVFYGLDHANKARERTILIVNAEHLTEVLKDWQMGQMPDRMFKIERLVRGL